MVAIGEKIPWPLTLRRSLCPTIIDVRDQVWTGETDCILM
jgi:hypothetical protein